MNPAIIATLILIIALILFATEYIPTPMTALMASLAMCILGITTPQQFTSGFSNPVTLFCFGIAVVGNALSESGCAVYLGKKLMNCFHLGEKGTLLILMSLAALFSMFLSNTSVVVVFMNLVTAMSISSPDKITRKNTFMAIGFATVAGGGSTLIGSTTQLAINALLPSYGLPNFSLFSLAGPGIGVMGVLFIYYYFIGYYRQKKVFTFEEKDIAGHVPLQQDLFNSYCKIKMCIPLMILVGCIILTVIGWNIAIVGMLGALLAVLSKSISMKRMWELTDWNTLLIIAGGVGIAEGMKISGACDNIAGFFIWLLGAKSSPYLYLVVFIIIAAIMTNVMTNISTALILTPIVISIAVNMGVQPMPFVIGVVWGANMPFSTPIGASVITMTMQGGYRFKDYVKMGLPFNILAVICVIVLTPIIYPL